LDGDLEIWGDLIITNDLILNVTGTLTIHGNVTMGDDAVLDISGNVSVGGNFTGGTDAMVNVDGTLDVTGTIDTGAGSVLTGTGTVTTGSCTGDPDFCSGGPLPIELAYFNGRGKSSSIILNWTTTSEEQFDYFLVQKSANTVTFSDIGKVEGQGSKSTSLDYVFEDEKPFNGLNYYRLKAVDLDGTFEIFNVISIDFSFDRLPIAIYPNPTLNQKFTIENFDQSQSIYFELLNLFGNSVIQSSLNFGTNDYDLVNVKPGLYILQINHNNKIHTRRLIVD